MLQESNDIGASAYFLELGCVKTCRAERSKPLSSFAALVQDELRVGVVDPRYFVWLQVFDG